MLVWKQWTVSVCVWVLVCVETCWFKSIHCYCWLLLTPRKRLCESQSGWGGEHSMCPSRAKSELAFISNPIQYQWARLWSLSQAHLIGIKDGHVGPPCPNAPEIIIKKCVIWIKQHQRPYMRQKKICLHMPRHGPSIFRELGQRQREVGRFIGVESPY